MKRNYNKNFNLSDMDPVSVQDKCDVLGKKLEK